MTGGDADGRGANDRGAGGRASADAPTAMLYGVGPIGARVLAVAVERGYELLGGLDVDPEKVGRDLGDVAGLDPLGVDVTDDPDALAERSPDVVFHATGSSLAGVRPQLEAALAAGADVVSTCEELAYPFRHHPEAAEAVDAAAREGGASCLGTGINPGFAMDALPAMATAPCRRVEAVRVERVQDAATRRAPLQEKIGAGTSPADFESAVAAGAGHVGLPESVAMLAAAFGWELEAVEESVEPVVADERTASEHVTVEAGEVTGISQRAVGVVGGEERIVLDLEMYLGAPNPGDRVRVEGTPSLEYEVPGGLHGDVTTPAVVVNAARRVRSAGPGLLTMLDLAVPSYAGP